MMRKPGDLAQRGRGMLRAGRIRARARRRRSSVQDEIHRRAQADGAGDIGRAGLEFVGQSVVGGLGERHGKDHLAAALPRRHALEQLLAPVEHADAGGTEHLVAGERIEIAAQFLHVDRHVRDGLRAVDQGGDAARLGGGDQAPDRQHRARAHSIHARRRASACADSSAPRPRRRAPRRAHRWARPPSLAPVCSQTICQGTMLA